MGVEPRKIEVLTKVSGLNFIESKSHCDWIKEKDFKVPYIDFVVLEIDFYMRLRVFRLYFLYFYQNLAYLIWQA